jgi:hypothetical protein
MIKAEEIFVRFTSRITKDYPEYIIKDRQGFIDAIQEYAELYHAQFKEPVTDSSALPSDDIEGKTRPLIPTPQHQMSEIIRKNQEIYGWDIIARQAEKDAKHDLEAITEAIKTLPSDEAIEKAAPYYGKSSNEKWIAGAKAMRNGDIK